MADRKAELKDAFHRAFSLMDKNGDGSIDVDELCEGLSSVEINVGEDDIRAKIEEADKDGNGVIDFNEFLHMCLTPGGGSKTTEPRPIKKPSKKGRQYKSKINFVLSKEDQTTAETNRVLEESKRARLAGQAGQDQFAEQPDILITHVSPGLQNHVISSRQTRLQPRAASSPQDSFVTIPLPEQAPWVLTTQNVSMQQDESTFVLADLSGYLPASVFHQPSATGPLLAEATSMTSRPFTSTSPVGQYSCDFQVNTEPVQFNTTTTTTSAKTFPNNFKPTSETTGSSFSDLESLLDMVSPASLEQEAEAGTVVGDICPVCREPGLHLQCL